MNARYVVATHLTGPPARDRNPHPATVVDLVWAHATTADGLDHVRVQAHATAGELELVVLLRAETASDAIRAAEGLCTRATRSPALSGWNALSPRVLPMAALDS
ncbi:hypothetical protein P3T36_006450 [Kitasatospora sp. MAP12-15]|uniref:hypothetical protein n=1 Tax=unclassified Kitasatospora TaxID=2633591 RepID=UPI002476E76F|nr:hypothetical protein [Kitasatospora sp. MAP12-44]MDH6107838.1 hypothetical protein [Kitasatospora sp. MAP12-44]